MLQMISEIINSSLVYNLPTSQISGKSTSNFFELFFQQTDKTNGIELKTVAYFPPQTVTVVRTLWTLRAALMIATTMQCAAINRSTLHTRKKTIQQSEQRNILLVIDIRN